MHSAEGSTEVRLRDMISFVAAICIVAAPWFNGDDALTHHAVRMRLVAIAISAVSLWILFHQRQAVAEWINAALACALITAPCWRGGLDAQRVDAATAAILVAAFSVSCALEIAREERRDREFSRWLLRMAHERPSPFSGR
jgi:uncharacterized membrane protein YfcA